MSEHLIKQIEKVVRNIFYKTYSIETTDNQYIVRGGIVRDAKDNKKKRRKKKVKRYCATEYMKIEIAVDDE